MYYIEARNETQKWLSAISMDRKKAETCLGSIPESLRSIHTLRETPKNAYPIYLVEGDEFRFCDLNGLHAALLRVEIDPDFDGIYLNIHKISEDFESPKPGADYMGLLYHIHVENVFMKQYLQGQRGADPFVPTDAG